MSAIYVRKAPFGRPGVNALPRASSLVSAPPWGPAAFRLRSPTRLRLALCGALVLWALLATRVAPASAKPRVYDLDYLVELQPDKDAARVTIRIGKGGKVSRVDFALDPKRHSAVEAEGRLALEGGRAIWSPPPGGGSLSLTAKISHRRESGEYDACMTADWAIFRGDDLVPGARVRAAKGAASRAHLRFAMPAGWTHADTGWPRGEDGGFQIDNPARGFDRPVGWMIAGKAGTRRDTIGASEVSVAAPVGSPMRRMDVLTFLNVV